MLVIYGNIKLVKVMSARGLTAPDAVIWTCLLVFAKLFIIVLEFKTDRASSTCDSKPLVTDGFSSLTDFGFSSFYKMKCFVFEFIR